MCLSVEPDTDDGAVGDQPDDVFRVEQALRPRFPVGLHLPPDAADRILADRSLRIAASARRTRRVLVPARVVPAISASTWRVIRAERGSARLFHSKVPPLAVPMRARGTAISTVPNEPQSRRRR